MDGAGCFRFTAYRSDHSGLQAKYIITTHILLARTQLHGQPNCTGSWEIQESKGVGEHYNPHHTPERITALVLLCQHIG